MTSDQLKIGDCGRRGNPKREIRRPEDERRMGACVVARKFIFRFASSRECC